jgi:hypothetical protein
MIYVDELCEISAVDRPAELKYLMLNLQPVDSSSLGELIQVSHSSFFLEGWVTLVEGWATFLSCPDRGKQNSTARIGVQCKIQGELMHDVHDLNDCQLKGGQPTGRPANRLPSRHEIDIRSAATAGIRLS